VSGFRREQVAEGLDTRLVGRTVHHLETTTSTNDVVLRLAEEGAPEGVVVFAEEQTRGRGRHRRSWDSRRGRGLWFSVLLRPRVPAERLVFLPLCAAGAVARTIRERLGVPASLKWPNDVLVGDRKVAGVLVESRTADAGGPPVCVLGLGINVNHEAAELPETGGARATSLRIETGAEVDRPALARELLRALDRDYGALERGDEEPLATAVRELLGLVGRAVEVTADGRRLRGTLVALSPGEGLRLRLPDGSERRLRPEHVDLRLLPASPA
jgi:BirA family biotin operon repressor/biotin-[acetyl-CoA-carboxylase] ligase